MMDHHPQCPLHEDYELDEKEQSWIDPADVLDLVRATDSNSPRAINMALRDFAWMLDCQCKEIEEAYREKAAEDRAER